VHSARWPEKLNLEGKTVAVIGGSGGSGVQIVPAIQPLVKKLVVYLRSRFWAVPGVGAPNYTGPAMENFQYTPEQIQMFRDQPELLEQYGRDVEDDLSFVYEAVSCSGLSR
jgi:hypothetical protein